MKAMFAFAAAAICLQAQPKEVPPAGGAPKAFNVPRRQALTLKNGMRASLVPYGNIPKVTVAVAVRAGNINEAANQVWLADLAGELMKEGAGARSGEQLAQEVARMGGQLSVTVSPDRTLISADVLSEFAPSLVRLLADVVQRPTLPAGEIERLKNNLLRRLAVAKATPDSLADEAFAKILYPDHPYGRYFPTEAMIQSYTIEDARKFYRSNFGAARSQVYVVGRFDAGLSDVIKTAFDGWPRGAAAASLPPQPVRARTLTVVDRPGSVQSTLRVGLPVAEPGSPDWIAQQVTNSILGGSFGSRITTNIREKKGYTYSPYSVVTTHYRNAHWVQNADVSTAVTGASLKEIFFEIERMRTEPVPEDELTGIKNYMAGRFVLRNSSREGILDQLLFADMQELGDDYIRTYVQRVHAVTPADIQRVARTRIDPSKMTLVVVGDKSKITPQLN